MKRPIDIEDAVWNVLDKENITVYCRPLPKNYALPNILVTATGGSQETDWFGADTLDTFTVKLDCRGESEASALEYLRSAIGVLQCSPGGLSSVRVNSLYSWGEDSTRPDLAMCSATLLIQARPETF